MAMGKQKSRPTELKNWSKHGSELLCANGAEMVIAGCDGEAFRT
jgi:hypothetical protein